MVPKFNYLRYRFMIDLLLFISCLKVIETFNSTTAIFTTKFNTLVTPKLCKRGLKCYNGDCFSLGIIGKCRCDSGWFGRSCDKKCDFPCINGTRDCTKNTPVCLCVEGYKGDNCSQIITDGNYTMCLKTKCFNGKCKKDPRVGSKCQCHENWVGTHCNQTCSRCVHGNCVQLNKKPVCNCEFRYTGKHCDVKAPVSCGKTLCYNGVCNQINISNVDNKTCVCEQSWALPYCNETCPKPCNNGGVCYSGSVTGAPSCRCPPGFNGQTCETENNAVVSTIMLPHTTSMAYTHITSKNVATLGAALMSVVINKLSFQH